MIVYIHYLERRLEKSVSVDMSAYTHICTEGWNFLQSTNPGET